MISNALNALNCVKMRWIALGTFLGTFRKNRVLRRCHLLSFQRLQSFVEKSIRNSSPWSSTTDLREIGGFSFVWRHNKSGQLYITRLYKLEFVCIFFYILSTRPSISLLICSGSSVFELCPAPLIHSILIPDLLCHFLLYLIHEPAWSLSPHISKAGHFISYGRSASIASASIQAPLELIQ